MRRATLSAALVLLAGCATSPVVVHNREDLLAAAGFASRTVTTPAQQQVYAALPPDHLMRRPYGPGFVYLYADTTLCHCLYIGNQAAYDAYQREMLSQKIAQENFDAQLDENTWEPGPWGPGGY